jgi:hypothetical protein
MNNATYFSKSGIAALLSVVENCFSIFERMAGRSRYFASFISIVPSYGLFKYHHP